MPSAKPTHRIEGREKVTGTARYTADYPHPGLAHALLVQSPIARGCIRRIDTAAAEAQPGVLLVLTHRNRPPLQPLPEEYTSAFPGERRPPLEDEQILYAGQHIAVIVAETLEQAQSAETFLHIEYLGEDPVLHPGQTLDQAYQPTHFAKNDTEALQSRRGHPDSIHPAVRLDLDYETAIVHHNPIEPSATLAIWNGQHLTLHDSTRWLYGTRMFVATMLGIPQDRVRVLCPFVGGAFGSKGFLWQHVVLAALAARLTGRPVRQTLSRRQMFTSTGHRPRTVQAVSLGADAEGHLQLIRHLSLNDTSSVAHFVEPAAMVSRHLYRCPHVEIAHRVAPTHIATPCFMRAPGEAPGMFALESAMDELAVALSLDPLELRLRNDAERDEQADRPWSSKHLRECLLQGAERFGWYRRPSAPRSMPHGEWLTGWGTAAAAYPGRRAQSAVHAQLLPSGEAVFSTATHELGTGTRTMIAEAAADTLGFARNRIRVEIGDSSLPPSPVHGASQATATIAPAVLRAAADLRHQLTLLAVTDAASPLLDADPSRILIEDGILHLAHDPTRRVSAADLLARLGHPLEATAEAKSGPEKEQFTWTSFGAHFTEVHVHASTGEVRVARWVGVFDPGRVLNPVLARAQIEGGILFGIGMALMEQTLYDPHTGAPINPSLAEYLVPTCADTPPAIDISFIDAPDLRFNPLGVRGLGELGVAGAPAAIANAIFNATGKRQRRLPITLDQLQP